MPFEATQAAFRRRVVLEQISRYAPGTLLEVGCGLVPLFTDLSAEMDICVIEPSSEFMSHALPLADGRTNVNLVQGYLEEFAEDYNLGGFDFIVLSGLLHEVEDPMRMLAAARRLCHVGSVIHINVPNAQSLHRLLAMEMGLIDNPFELSTTQKYLQQHTTYDIALLAQQITAAGFAIIDSGSYFIKPFTHAQMENLLRSGFLSEAILEGLYGLIRHMPGMGSEIYLNARISDV